MTKDEIKKALACYEKIDLDCHKCPYNIYDECCIQVRGDALDLITEQEEHIKIQNQQLSNWEKNYTQSFERLKAQQREIDELKANINQSQDQILETAQKNQEYCEQQVKQAQLNILGKLWSNISNSKQLIQSHIADGSFTIEDIYMEIDELMTEVQNGKDKS